MGGNRDNGGLSKGTKNEAVDSEHGGQQGQKFPASYKEPPFQVRAYIFTFINTTHAINIIYMPAKLFVKKYLLSSAS
jgi:hypothetical protein